MRETDDRKPVWISTTDTDLYTYSCVVESQQPNDSEWHRYCVAVVEEFKSVVHDVQEQETVHGGHS